MRNACKVPFVGLGALRSLGGSSSLPWELAFLLGMRRRIDDGKQEDMVEKQKQKGRGEGRTNSSPSLVQSV